MTIPSITVVIPVYNAENTICEALDSVLQQTIIPSNIIVVDDLSTDNTCETVKEHMNNLTRKTCEISLIRQSKNGGPASARNAGIEASESEWIAFLDGDDKWLPQKLKTQTNISLNNPEVKLICSKTLPLLENTNRNPDKITYNQSQCGGEIASRRDAKGERAEHRTDTAPLNGTSRDTIPQLHSQKTGQGRDTIPPLHFNACSDKKGDADIILKLNDFIYSNPVATSTVLVKRAVLLEAGSFDEQFCGPEDYDLWLRIAEKHKIIKTKEALSLYRHVEGSLSMDDRTFLPQVLAVLEKAFSNSGALHQYKHLKKRAYAEKYSSASWMAFNRQDRLTALHHLFKSYTIYPKRIQPEENDPLLRIKLLLRYIGIIKNKQCGSGIASRQADAVSRKNRHVSHVVSCGHGRDAIPRLHSQSSGHRRDTIPRLHSQTSGQRRDTIPRLHSSHFTLHTSDYPRVAHLVISLAHGGLEQCALQWCVARNQKHPGSTIIICLDEPGELAYEIKETEVIALHANRHKFPWDRKAVKRLRSVITDNKIDLIHSHNTAARQYACLVRRNYRQKPTNGVSKSLVQDTQATWEVADKEQRSNDKGQRTKKLFHLYTDHSSNIYLHGIINHIRLIFMKRGTDAYVAVSDEAAKKISLAEKITLPNISVIKNGIKINQHSSNSLSKNSIRETINLEPNDFVIGYVGRLSYEKGVDRLIEAFAKCSCGIVSRKPVADRIETCSHEIASHPSATGGQTHCKLVLVGDGDMSEELKALVETLGISNQVIFTGSQANARSLMRAFDLFVLPSRSEGLPLALLEAMAESVPVAVTDVGECAKVVNHGKLGLILPKEPEEWPQEINKVIESIKNGEFSTKVNNAVNNISGNYSIDKTIEEYEAKYKQICNIV